MLLCSAATAYAGPRTDTDTVIIGAGPNGLRVSSCLQRANVPHVVVDASAKLGSTVAMWYEGSLTHSRSNLLTIGGIRLFECTQCLDVAYGLPHTCELDDGHADHCGRDEYLAYMGRVVRQLQLRVVMGTRVAGVKLLPDGLLEVLTQNSTQGNTHGADKNSQEETAHVLARSVVLAIGASSFQRQLRLDPPQYAARIEAGLMNPARYVNSTAVVVGIGPSGLEAALRLCSYGAKHVALLSRQPIVHGMGQVVAGLRYAMRLQPNMSGVKNKYFLPAFPLMRRYVDAGQLSIHSGSITRLGEHDAFLSSGAVVPAAHVIAHIGYTTDEALLKSMHFPNGRISRHSAPLLTLPVN
jgi:hypothetical protein